MAVIGNDEYAPACAASCTAETLAAVGNTDCVSDLSIEL